MRTFIITAGGIGKRMGGTQPKQFLLLAQEPVLMHTLRKLHLFDPEAQLILTLPETHLENWQKLCAQFHFSLPHEVISGGKERFHSVQNALKICKGTVIAVHDGVRPFVAHSTLQRLFDAVEKYPAVIPVIPVKDSMRQLTGNGNTAVNRNEFVLIQTPQVFSATLLYEAYLQPFSLAFTDDASVVEATGTLIHLVDGNEENIKLTNPSDLVIAEALLPLPFVK